MINIMTIKHKDISEIDIEKIIALKQQYWPYSYASQLQWIENNLHMEDVHILVEDKDDLIGYLNVVNIEIRDNTKVINCFGIGNLCVDRAHENKGWGSLILKIAGCLFLEQDAIGVLLCQEKVRPFYCKNGWIEINKNITTVINGSIFEGIVMTYGALQVYKGEININRSF